MKFALMGVGSGSTVRPDVLAEVAVRVRSWALSRPGFRSTWPYR